MTKLLERASTLLAVAGVALLMWTGAQTATAQAPAQQQPVAFVCAILYNLDDTPNGCKSGSCGAGLTCAFFPGNINGTWNCCITATPQ